MRLRTHHAESESVAEVVLSRRNLLALLQKLDMPGSARTLVMTEDCPPGWVLVVRADDDDEHYAHRDYGPGPMHPMTEISIAVATATTQLFEPDE